MIKKHGKKISEQELRDRVMNAGTSWHHHCLSPECYVNDTGEEIILLEERDDMYYCPSTKELREELEKHAYQLTNPRKGKRKPIKHEALDLAKQYSKKGTRWHFHIATPNCFLAMSEHYTLIVENDASRAKHEWPFDEKPVELVRAIDDYYLKRKK
ncbi:MAG: hypothetical protein V1668_02895 [Patescibacteria group bacterium]